MLYLREYRQKADRLFDHLPWVALIGPGLLLNNDGGFQKTLSYRGPDLTSATDPAGSPPAVSSTMRCAGWARAGVCK